MIVERIKKAKKLSNVKVKYISILTGDTKPSNMTGVIVKNKDGVSIDCQVEKFDEIKGLLYVQPMIALKSDTDGEYYENEDVEKSAHLFLKGDTEYPSDVNHNLNPVEGVKVVESFVDKSQENWIWKVALDISDNEELVKQAIEGKITGVSIYGTANVSVEDNPLIKATNDSLLDMLKIAFKEKMNAEYCWLSDLLVDGTAIFEIEYKEDDTWIYKYYQQAYSIVEGKVQLIGETKEVVRVSSYIEKVIKGRRKKSIGNLTVEIDIEPIQKMNKELEKTIALKKQLDVLEKKDELEDDVKKDDEVEKEANKNKKIKLKLKQED